MFKDFDFTADSNKTPSFKIFEMADDFLFNLKMRNKSKNTISKKRSIKKILMLRFK